MALINCPECSQEISDQAAKCPKCGYPIKAEQRKEAVTSAISAVGVTAVKVKRKVPWKIVLIVAVALCVVVVGGFFIFRDFWAKVFLDDEQYQVYEIYNSFKDISNLSGDCGTFYLYDNKYYGVEWAQSYDDIELYCYSHRVVLVDNKIGYTISINEKYRETSIFDNLLNDIEIKPRKIDNNENYYDKSNDIGYVVVDFYNDYDIKQFNKWKEQSIQVELPWLFR